MKTILIWFIIGLITLVGVEGYQSGIIGGTNLNDGGIAGVVQAVYHKAITYISADVTPPIISNLIVTKNNESANITWITDEAANYTFRLSTGAIYYNVSFVTSFYQNLTGLSNSTLYEYNITVCDVFGNCNTTENNQFITNNNKGYVFNPICTDTVKPNKLCTFITSISNCTSYTIYNLTGTKINNGSLFPLPFNNGYITYFNFNQSKGEYIIDICGSHYKEIKVKLSEDENMAVGFIIFIPLIFSFLFMYGASKLNDEFNLLKFLAYMFTFISLFSSLWFGTLYLIAEDIYPTLQDAMGKVIWFGSLIFLFVVGLFLYKFIRSPIDKEFEL